MSQETHNRRSTFAYYIILTLSLINGAAMGIGEYRTSGWGRAVSAFILTLSTGWALAQVVSVVLLNIGHAVQEIGNTMLVAVVSAAVAGVAYVLWKAITFAGSGTVSWFQWLFGHI